MPEKDVDLIRRWAAALRSGRYQQAQGSLSYQPGYDEGGEPKEENCCLGVLCRVAHLRKDWRDEVLLSDFDDGAKLMERIGLASDTEIRLAELNDKGLAFTEIADTIEKRLLRGEE